ncbi:50S ribosomal protein L30e-like protein [Annulohypoxylon nitens]|nr:50S ribosomal protein L30e-like protein [Annulohypoxylon nitens]
MGSTKPEKKEKKDKKRSEVDGVTKVKKEKKEKKDKKEKLKNAAAAHVEGRLEADSAAPTTAEKDDQVNDTEAVAPLVGALVPFAKPLADESATKKIMKTVRKSAKHRTLKRGVKEVVKSLRKSPTSGPGNTSFPGVVILAGDISPADVISHIPVLCEDVNVPYIFVASRAELGAAGVTKRPTSVVMVTETQTKRTKENELTDMKPEEYAAIYKDLVKLVEKASKKQLKA